MPNDSLQCVGVSTEYPGAERIDQHQHEEHQIIHASQGVMRVNQENACWIVPPGRALWMPAQLEHEIYCHSAVSMRTLYLKGNPEWVPEKCQVWSVSPLLREVIIRLSANTETPHRRHLLALLALEIQSIEIEPTLLPMPASVPTRKLANALILSPSNNRSLREWATLLAMSERNLIRRFRDETGMTFRQWRRQARMLSALEMLAHGDAVSHVAYRCGFDSVSAFVAAFRLLYGTTPGRYFND